MQRTLPRCTRPPARQAHGLPAQCVCARTHRRRQAPYPQRPRPSCGPSRVPRRKAGLCPWDGSGAIGAETRFGGRAPAVLALTAQPGLIFIPAPAPTLGGFRMADSYPAARAGGTGGAGPGRRGGLFGFEHRTFSEPVDGALALARVLPGQCKVQHRHPHSRGGSWVICIVIDASPTTPTPQRLIATAAGTRRDDVDPARPDLGPSSSRASQNRRTHPAALRTKRASRSAATMRRLPGPGRGAAHRQSGSLSASSASSPQGGWLGGRRAAIGAGPAPSPGPGQRRHRQGRRGLPASSSDRHTRRLDPRLLPASGHAPTPP